MNPVFASFSLFSAEDFGVSVAQAREQGWPVILSNWGGQRDVKGKSVIKISAHSIPEAWESLASLLIKGEYLARLIVKNWSAQFPLSPIELEAPIVLDVSCLHKRRQGLIKKLDTNFFDLYAGEGKIDNFFKTNSGKKIYAQYRHVFAGPLSDKSQLLMITHDMEPRAGEVVALVPELTQRWLHYALEEDLEVNFIFVRNLMKRLNFYRFANLHSLVFPFFINSLLPLVQFLTRDYVLSCPLLAFYNEEQDGIHEEIILKNIRPQDAYVLTTRQALEQIAFGQNPLVHLQELRKIKSSEFFSVIELEINRDCNRQCSYCPNALLKRETAPLMDEKLYLKIIDELQSLSFEGILSFHFYNEPLLHPKLVDYIALASKKIPQARLYLYSNGTLLTQEKFKALVNAGITLLIVTQHEGVEHLDLNNWRDQLSEKERKLLVVQQQEKVQKTNRGGLLPLGKNAPLKLSCYMPSSMLVVTSEGNVLPCYEDYGEKLKLGNLRDQTLKELWNSSRAKELKEKLAQGQRSDFEPCKNCNNSRIFPIR